MDATIRARTRQLEEVKRSCGPLVRAYAVMQQSLDLASNGCKDFKICPKCNKNSRKLE